MHDQINNVMRVGADHSAPTFSDEVFSLFS